MESIGPNHIQNGLITYVSHNMIDDTTLDFNNNFIVTQQTNKLLRFKVIGSDIYYNRFDSNT